MDVARRAGIPEDKLVLLDAMNLKDIRDLLLEYVGTDITGNDYDSSQQRHTRFYRLRFDDIMRLGEGSY